MTNNFELTIRPLRDDELHAAFRIVVQLRKHLEVQEFVARVGRQSAAGYELLGAWVVLTFYEALGYARHTAILVKKGIAAG